MKRSPSRAEILPVGEDHLHALAELAGVIWRQYYPGIISHEQIDYMLGKMYSLETLRADLRSQRVHFYRLVVDGRMAGFTAIGPLDVPGDWKIHKLYLLPELHGCGLGSRLVQHCEAEARRFGAQRLMLAVNQRNARPIAAYRRNGFAVVQSVVTDFGAGFVMDDFIMTKELKAGAA